MDNFDIGRIYKELIDNLSNIGYSSTISYDEKNVFIQVKNSNGERFLQFRLNYSVSYQEYDYEHLQVAWRLLGVSNFSTPHKFHKDMDQKVMFEIILFEITNWKLQNLDKVITKTISNTLNSNAISNWLKTKEEQIREEERAKIENHLSMDDFRQIVKEELGKINIQIAVKDGK